MGCTQAVGNVHDLAEDTPTSSVSTAHPSSKDVPTDLSTVEPIAASNQEVVCSVSDADIPRFEDDFEILTSIVGRGWSGSVVYARSRTTGLKHAVKWLSKADAGPDRLLNFHNEVDIHLSLQHPNIVKLQQVYSTDDNLFLVMDLLDGGDVAQVLKRDGAFGEARARGLLRQMLLALEHLHSAMVAHRDIKPEHFMYVQRNWHEIRLIDFGFACPSSRSMSLMCGTKAYIAPEVLSGKYTEKVDLWSLGVVAWQLFSGLPCEDSQRRPLTGLPDGAIDFSKSLLQVDPQIRMSAAEALHHPWLLEKTVILI